MGYAAGVKRLHHWLIVLAVIAPVAGGACAYRGTIGVALMRRKAAGTIFNDTIAALPDGLHVGLCGTGSPFPSPTRSGPCTAVIAGKRLDIVDAGRGAASVVARMGLQTSRIGAVLLTHYHADHVDGLGQLAEMYWLAGGAKAPLLVMGPAGVERVVDGFNNVYALNGSYRVAVDGPAVAAPTGLGLTARTFQIRAETDFAIILQQDELRVTAFNVDHAIGGPAVGYRFDYKGRSVVISGDTAKSTNLARVAHGTNLLVHEAMSPRLVDVLKEEAVAAGRVNPAHLLQNLQALHTPPGDEADVASEAGAHALVLTHLISPVPGGILQGPFLDGACSAGSRVLSGSERTAIRSACRPGGGTPTTRNLF